MTKSKFFGKSLHKAAQLFASDCKAGKMSRREFMTRATALGVAVPAAYGLLGLQSPALAGAHAAAKRGGTLKMQMNLPALKDPRLFDWSEIGNVARGWLEYLVQYERDGSLTPMLLEGWSASADATEYTLNVRQGVKWNNGDDFTAEDVVFNIGRWCDGTVEGNSMASRLTALQDPDTQQLRPGAAVAVDSHTVKLTLSIADIAIIVGLADYPAALVHQNYDDSAPLAEAVGTGPYLLEQYDTGIQAVLVRNENHTWWGEGAYLDRIEFNDLGSDPSSWMAAIESGDIDIVYQSSGDFIDIFNSIGMEQTSAVTASTIAVRFNQDQEPYNNVNVRRALQLAVDNTLVLELGYNDRGDAAENHHVCPIHPEYAELAPLTHDPAGALAMIQAEGLGDFEFELISIDEDWEAATCDSIAAQIRAAGINIKRTILPGSTFWNDWTKYPFSSTAWNMRPLGV
jgi:peptide/nickel transport system substrate-binding protein